MNNYLMGYESILPETFLEKNVSELKNLSYIHGIIEVDKMSPYYPSRSDEKVMRQDVKASILSINELLQKTGLTNLAKTSLFVANGVFIEKPEKHLSRVVNVYSKLDENVTEEEKTRKIYFACPPLIALETLTNSTMSFIAQYVGLKSHNTTFGNSSISTFYAVKEALTSLKENEFSIVSSSNCSGDTSFLSNASISVDSEGWKESTSVGCLLITQSELTPDNALCRITYLQNGKKIPNLESNAVERNWKEIIPSSKADVIIFSGAYTKNEYERDYKYCKEINSNVFSFYPEFGNMGTSNIALGIAKGAEFISEGKQVVDVVDRDIYGRESLVRIEKC